GRKLWHKDLGRLEHIWGNASSPILYGDLAVLWCGPGERQFLLAVHKATGETDWERPEPGGRSGADGNWVGSWCTPVVTRVGGHDLWEQERVSGTSWGSLVAAAGRLYVTDKAGDTHVLAARPRLERLAKNSLKEPVLASIAVAGDNLFIRSHKHLWCLGEKK